MESFLRSLMALSFVTVNALFGAAIGLPLHSANAKDCFNFGAGAANVERPLNYIRNRRDGLASTTLADLLRPPLVANPFSTMRALLRRQSSAAFGDCRAPRR